jgi:uncharacterized protein YsxB (DUF464 family)
VIKVNIVKANQSIVSVDVTGHADYSESGRDIVCSAVSALTQAALLGLTDVVKLDINFTRRDGLLQFSVPKDITRAERHDCDIVLDTLAAALADLCKGYGDFIKLEVN